MLALGACTSGSTASDPPASSVETSPPAESSSVGEGADTAEGVVPDSVPPVPTEPKDCRVDVCDLLVVGDSVSDGQDTWRNTFMELSSEAGYQFEPVGARRLAAPGEEIPLWAQESIYDPSPGEDDRYDAFGGACIGDGEVTDCANLSPSTSFRGTDAGLWGRIDIWSEIIDTPDVIVLLAGHNGGGSKADQFDEYLEKLFTVVPDTTWVFISPTGGAVAEYDAIAQIAERYEADDKLVYAVSSYDGVTSPDMVHPDENGTIVLANNMFAGIDPVLSSPN